MSYAETGKTFTMSGNKQSPGIIPLTIQNIFGYIEETPEREFLLRCSYIEINNEYLHDLLDSSNFNLQIFEDKNQGLVDIKPNEEICKSADQAYSFMKIGDRNKRNHHERGIRSISW